LFISAECQNKLLGFCSDYYYQSKNLLKIVYIGPFIKKICKKSMKSWEQSLCRLHISISLAVGGIDFKSGRCILPENKGFLKGVFHQFSFVNWCNRRRGLAIFYTATGRENTENCRRHEIVKEI